MLTSSYQSAFYQAGCASVTAVILNFKHYDETIKCVHNLLKQEYAELRCVVVDNASPDDSLVRLKDALGSHPRVTILSAGTNGGYASGNNLGARWAIAEQKPQYIFIVNPDAILDDNLTITKLVSFANLQTDAGAVSPKVILPSGFIQGPYSRPSIVLSTVQFFFPLLWFMLRNHHQRVFRDATNPRRCFWTIGACMLLRADSFVEVNMFDEATFLESEEPILAERLRRVGKYFYYVPTTIVMHKHTRAENYKHTLASRTYYFKAYRRHSNFAIKVFELSARFYQIVYLPLQRYLDKAFLVKSHRRDL
jgi:GT2 family glycosyltransferase